MANPLHGVPHIPDSLLDVAVDPRKEPELATDLLRQRLGHELEEIERLRTIAASMGGGLLPAGAGGAGGAAYQIVGAMKDHKLPGYLACRKAAKERDVTAFNNQPVCPHTATPNYNKVPSSAALPPAITDMTT